MKQQYDDTYLARWAADELSEQELKDFKASDDYMYYKQIVDELEDAKFPEYDLDYNFEATLQKIEKQHKETKKVKRLWPVWTSAIAACLIVCFGLLFFLKESTYSTQLAQQLQIELPDQSEVNLNSDSELTYKTFRWNQNRELNLKGEAFFKVNKGKAFTVNTSQGSVTVLGTQFTVNSRENYFNVICYEGKVKVTANNKKPIVLTKGEAVQFKANLIEEYTVQSNIPEWLSKESSFYNTPILEVINELERQYNITIKGKEYLKSNQFTGRFKHDNLELALKTIFISMDIPYTFADNKIVVIKKY
ncbi:MAG: DUF4974 domain-containing protein [Winogradskyella sp.]